MKSEITHRAGSGPDVKRIARVHQNDAQVLEFRGNRQAIYFTSASAEQRFGSLLAGRLVESHPIGEVSRTVPGVTHPNHALHAPCRNPLVLCSAIVKELSNDAIQPENGSKPL